MQLDEPYKNIIVKTWLSISLLLLVGCGNVKSQSKVPVTPTESKFLWDFSAPRKFIYSFSQTVDAENKMGKEDNLEKSWATMHGYLTVGVKNKKHADLSLTDMDMNAVGLSKDGTPKDTIKQKVPTQVVQNMKPDGSFADANNDVLFDVLFPLPNENLQVGQYEELPLRMPFNAGGSALFVHGQNKLLFSGFQVVEGKNCAVLVGEIDISQLVVPDVLTGEYSCSTIGTGVYYFDLENGFYVGADIQLTMDLLMDLTSDSDGEKTFGMYLGLKTDNVYKIRLLRIED